MRERYKRSDQRQSCLCGEDDYSKLHLHHKTYERLGHERIEDLSWLCVGCHTAVHVLARRGDLGIDLEGFSSIERAAIYRRQQELMKSRQRSEDQALREAQMDFLKQFPFEERIDRVRRVAKKRGVDVPKDLRNVRQALDRRNNGGYSGRQLYGCLARAERLAYGWSHKRPPPFIDQDGKPVYELSLAVACALGSNHRPLRNWVVTAPDGSKVMDLPGPRNAALKRHRPTTTRR